MTVTKFTERMTLETRDTICRHKAKDSTSSLACRTEAKKRADVDNLLRKDETVTFINQTHIGTVAVATTKLGETPDRLV